MLSCLLILGKNSQEYGNWQVARKSSRPKSCRPKVFVMLPEILSHVARRKIKFKKSLKKI